MMQIPENCRKIKVRFRLHDDDYLGDMPDWVIEKGEESREDAAARMGRHQAHPGELIDEFERGVFVGGSIADKLHALGFRCVSVSVQDRTDRETVAVVPPYNKRRVVEESTKGTVKIGSRELSISGKVFHLELDYTVVTFVFVLSEEPLPDDLAGRAYLEALADIGWGRVRVFKNPLVHDDVVGEGSVLSINFDSIVEKPSEKNRIVGDAHRWGIRKITNRRHLIDAGETRIGEAWTHGERFIGHDELARAIGYGDPE